MKQPVLYVAALLVTIGLAGCGTGSQGTAGTSPSGSAASASSAPVAAAATGAAPQKVGAVVDFTAVTKTVSAASKAKGSVHLTSTLAGTGAVEMDLDLRASSARGSVDVGGPNLKVLIVDKVAYLGGGVTRNLGAKTPWLQIDPKGTDPLSQKLAPLVTSLRAASSDPAASLSSVAGAKATVTAASATSTTYRVNLSAVQLTELAKKQPGVAKAAGKNVTLDYTISSAGLPQKVGITAGKSVVVSYTYSGWGVPLKISAPPASEVTLTSALAAAA